MAVYLSGGTQETAMVSIPRPVSIDQESHEGWCMLDALGAKPEPRILTPPDIHPLGRHCKRLFGSGDAWLSARIVGPNIEKLLYVATRGCMEP